MTRGGVLLFNLIVKISPYFLAHSSIKDRGLIIHWANCKNAGVCGPFGRGINFSLVSV
jgi:hypothetical protein